MPSREAAAGVWRWVECPRLAVRRRSLPRALDRAATRCARRVYNIGGLNERTNLEIVHTICDTVDKLCPNLPHGSCRSLITYVKDRPGHDRRYAIDCSKIDRELGWKPSVNFAEGLRETIQWYLNNKTWVSGVTSAATVANGWGSELPQSPDVACRLACEERTFFKFRSKDGSLMYKLLLCFAISARAGLRLLRSLVSRWRGDDDRCQQRHVGLHQRDDGSAARQLFGSDAREHRPRRVRRS